MANKEKALREKEGKNESNKANTVNGTGGTPIHVNTLQVKTLGQVEQQHVRTYLCSLHYF